MREYVVLTLMIALNGCAHVKQPERIARIEDLDNPLRAIFHPDIAYTEVWQRSRIAHQATVTAIIREDGCVADAAITLATNPDIGRAAIDAVKKWRFEPPTVRGVPTKVRVDIAMPSTLENTKFIFPEKTEPNKAPEPTPTAAGFPQGSEVFNAIAGVAHL